MTRGGGKMLIITVIAIATLALAPFSALADDPIPTTVTVPPTPAPSVGPVTVTTTTTATLSTTAPTLSNTTSASVGSTPTSSSPPPVQITSSQPITATTTTTVAPTTSTPVVTTADVSGPGTSGTGTAGVSTTETPTKVESTPPSGLTRGLPQDAGVPPQPTTTVDQEVHEKPSVGFPANPAGLHSNDPQAIDAQLDAGTTKTDEAGKTKTTDVDAAVSDPKSGVALSARATAALCLLSKALASTDLTARPITTATLSTLCKDDPSTAGGSLSAKLPGIASGTIDANATICLIAKAVGLPSGLPSEGVISDVISKDGKLKLNPVATATIQAACARAGEGSPDGKGSPKGGPVPDTLTIDGDVDVPHVGPTTFGTAAAVCLLGVASGGIPTTASVSSLCGTTEDRPGPSTVDTRGSTRITDVDLTPAGDVSACLVGNATVNVPTSATVGSACPAPIPPGSNPSGGTPSTVDITGRGDLPDTMPDATLHAANCIVASALVGPGGASLDLGDACPGTAPTAPGPGSGPAPTTTTRPTTPATPSTVAGEGSAPQGEISAPSVVTAPAGGVTSPAGNPEGPAAPQGGPVGIAGLPSTSTAAAGAGLIVALIATMAALGRRRRPR